VEFQATLVIVLHPYSVIILPQSISFPILLVGTLQWLILILMLATLTKNLLMIIMRGIGSEQTSMCLLPVLKSME